MILVVEPDELSRSLLEAGLREKGYEVVSAAGAQDAQRFLSPDRRAPSLIFCEAELHTGDGVSLCQFLRSNPRTADVPIVLLARSPESFQREAAAGGSADQFLPRPLFLNDALALATLLAGRRSSQGQYEADTRSLPVAHVLRALLSGVRPGRIVFPHLQAHVTFRDGQVIDAAFGDVSGEAALIRTLLLGEGAYTVAFTAVPGQGAMSYSLMDLVLRALPVVQRWLGLIAAGLPLEMILVVDFGRFRSLNEELPPEVSGMLRLFDGRRTVREVVAESGLEEVAALEIVSRLHGMKLLIQERRQTPRTAKPQPPPGEPERRVSLYEYTETLDPQMLRQLDALRTRPAANGAPKPANGAGHSVAPTIPPVTPATPQATAAAAPPLQPPAAAPQPPGAVQTASMAQPKTTTAAPTTRPAPPSGWAPIPPAPQAVSAQPPAPVSPPQPVATPPAPAPVAPAPAPQPQPAQPPEAPLAAPAPIQLTQPVDVPPEGSETASSVSSAVAQAAEALQSLPEASVATPPEAPHTHDAGHASDDELLALVKPKSKLPMILGGVAVVGVIAAVVAFWPKGDESSKPEVGDPVAVTEAPEGTTPGEGRGGVVPAAAMKPALTLETAGGETTDATFIDGGPIALAEASRLYEAQRFAEAAKLLEEVIGADPSIPQAWLQLGLARFDSGDVAGAQEAAARALELDAGNGRALILLATIHLEQRERAKAQEELKRYLELYPDGPFANDARLLLRQ